MTYGTITGGTVLGNSTSKLIASHSILSGSTANLIGVTLDTDLDNTHTQNKQTVSFSNGLTLLNNHKIELNIGNSLVASDASVLNGTGEVVMNDMPYSSNYKSTITIPTIGSDIIIRTHQDFWFWAIWRQIV